MPGHGHLFEQQGAGFVGAAFEGVVGGAGDVGQHVLQAAGDGDFLHGVGDLTVFHPKAGGAAPVTPGHGDRLGQPEQAPGDEDAAAPWARSRGDEPVAAGLDGQIVVGEAVRGGDGHEGPPGGVEIGRGAWPP